MESMAPSKRQSPPPRPPSGSAQSRRRSADETGSVPESFYKDLVWNLRNGVLAVTRDGRIAVMNEVAFHIFGVPPHSNVIGRPYTEVFTDLPDVTIGDMTRRLQAGDSYLVPGDVQHGAFAIEAGVLVDVFTPKRDDFA